MKYVINSQEHPIGKVKDFIYKISFFSGLKIYPMISVVTLVMF